jgi:hypothetical protein
LTVTAGGIGNHPYLVHYVLTEGPNRGQCRPAVVVRDWQEEDMRRYGAVNPESSQNLLVFVDGSNDNLGGGHVLWATSIHRTQDGAPGTWHDARDCEAVQAAVQAAAQAPAQDEAAAVETPPPDPAPDPGPVTDFSDLGPQTLEADGA